VQPDSLIKRKHSKINPNFPVIERRNGAFLLLVMAIGLLGVSTLLLAPLEQFLPPGVEVPRVVLLIQPAVLVIGASLLGWWAAPKVGLDAPSLGELTRGGDWFGALKGALVLALVGGVLGAAVLFVYAQATASYFEKQSAGLDLPMLTRLGYGGAAEEIIVRWGLMSGLALAALKLGFGRPCALWAGNLAAALVFALGHVPALVALVDPPGWLLAAALIGNTSVGLLFGWVFARRGLEAAIIAHGSAHLLAVSALLQLG
jgi:hypothetical protein